MLLEQILFFVAAAGAIGGALGVVLLRNPFFSVLALVGHLVALALLFLLLRAEFVAAAQLVVYAGAVMVLYIFVVAYIGGVEETVAGGGLVGRVGPVFAATLLVAAVGAVVLARRRLGLEDEADDELTERAGRAPIGGPEGRAGDSEPEPEPVGGSA